MHEKSGMHLLPNVSRYVLRIGILSAGIVLRPACRDGIRGCSTGSVVLLNAMEAIPNVQHCRLRYLQPPLHLHGLCPPRPLCIVSDLHLVHALPHLRHPTWNVGVLWSGPAKLAPTESGHAICTSSPAKCNVHSLCCRIPLPDDTVCHCRIRNRLPMDSWNCKHGHIRCRLQESVQRECFGLHPPGAAAVRYHLDHDASAKSAEHVESKSECRGWHDTARGLVSGWNGWRLPAWTFKSQGWWWRLWLRPWPICHGEH
mmetsp:Transcript_37397/g.76119  ORF Transcript_37397/g.76119 Transcript_37397/m.76119 type:complete len:257 (-) Transcript_37397:295-1065(-)